MRLRPKVTTEIEAIRLYPATDWPAWVVNEIFSRRLSFSFPVNRAAVAELILDEGITRKVPLHDAWLVRIGPQIDLVPHDHIATKYLYEDGREILPRQLSSLEPAQ